MRYFYVELLSWGNWIAIFYDDFHDLWKYMKKHGCRLNSIIQSFSSQLIFPILGYRYLCRLHRSPSPDSWPYGTAFWIKTPQISIYPSKVPLYPLCALLSYQYLSLFPISICLWSWIWFYVQWLDLAQSCGNRIAPCRGVTQRTHKSVSICQ